MATLSRLGLVLRNCATNITHVFQRCKKTKTGVFETGLCFVLGGAVAYYCYDHAGHGRTLCSGQALAPLLQTVAAKEKVRQLCACTLCRILLTITLINCVLKHTCVFIAVDSHVPMFSCVHVVLLFGSVRHGFSVL